MWLFRAVITRGVPPTRSSILTSGKACARGAHALFALREVPEQQGGSTLHRKGTHVNKQELIDVVAKTADISKAAAGRALDGAITAIKGSLKKGQTVTLVGFGTFYVGKRAARSGRNPRTGAASRSGPPRCPKFRAGKALKDSVN